MRTGMNYSLAQVRAQDPDRFHLAMVAPRVAQEPWIALAAFHLEISRTTHRVTDPNLGLIRLQWWQEVLDEIEGAGPVRGHQVALELAKFRAQLDFDALRNLVQAYEVDLAETPFDQVETLRAHLMQSAGGLLIAQSRFLNLEGAEAMANHLGCAFGFVGRARAMAGGGSENSGGTYPRLPTSWQDDPLLGVAEAIGQAAMHLDRARELRRESSNSRALSPLFAMGTLIEWWLRVFDQTPNPLGQSRFSRPLPFQALRLSFIRGG